MIYYIYKDDKVYGCTEFEELIEDIAIANEISEYFVGQTEFEEYTPNNNRYLLDNGEIVLNPDYEAEQAQKEKERIQELFMTRSDFFDGTIDAWGVGEDELLFLVQRMLISLPLENKQKLKAINNFNNALNFYRKHDLFKMLIGIPIQLTETTQVIITEESLDKYFDEVAKGNKDTAWQYLPQPIAIPIETNTTNNSSYDDI